jgi:ribosomal protein L32
MMEKWGSNFCHATVASSSAENHALLASFHDCSGTVSLAATGGIRKHDLRTMSPFIKRVTRYSSCSKCGLYILSHSMTVSIREVTTLCG